MFFRWLFFSKSQSFAFVFVGLWWILMGCAGAPRKTGNKWFPLRVSCSERCDLNASQRTYRRYPSLCAVDRRRSRDVAGRWTGFPRIPTFIRRRVTRSAVANLRKSLGASLALPQQPACRKQRWVAPVMHCYAPKLNLSSEDLSELFSVGRLLLSGCDRRVTACFCHWLVGFPARQMLFIEPSPLNFGSWFSHFLNAASRTSSPNCGYRVLRSPNADTNGQLPWSDVLGISSHLLSPNTVTGVQLPGKWFLDYRKTWISCHPIASKH